MRNYATPKVVVSKCLEFDACRWNGAMIPDAFIRKLKAYVSFNPVCPEFEIGLGIPRNPIRIVKKGNSLRLMQPVTGKDMTAEMIRFSDSFLSSINEVEGFILKGRSPSCGIKDVKYYPGTEKSMSVEKGSGFFGGAVLKKFSDTAVEDEGRLSNFKIREHFLTRLFALADWRELKKAQSMSKLVGFHAANKLLLMAYNQKELRFLGKIVANHEKRSLTDVYSEYDAHFKKALENMPRYTSNINVLMHALGYFSEKLSGKEKSHFLAILEKYRKGMVPLSGPLSVLQSWISRFDQNYLEQQTYFEPYPEELVEITDSGKGRDS